MDATLVVWPMTLRGLRVASTKREVAAGRVKAGCLGKAGGGLPRRVIAGRRPR